MTAAAAALVVLLPSLTPVMLIKAFGRFPDSPRALLPDMRASRRPEGTGSSFEVNLYTREVFPAPPLSLANGGKDAAATAAAAAAALEGSELFHLRMTPRRRGPAGGQLPGTAVGPAAAATAAATGLRARCSISRWPVEGAGGGDQWGGAGGGGICGSGGGGICSSVPHVAARPSRTSQISSRETCAARLRKACMHAGFSASNGRTAWLIENPSMGRLTERRRQ